MNPNVRRIAFFIHRHQSTIPSEVIMRRQILTIIATVLLPLGISQGAQNWLTEQPGAQSWVFSSDENGGKTSYLGVDIADVTTERLSALKLKEEKGVEVTMVDQDA